MRAPFILGVTCFVSACCSCPDAGPPPPIAPVASTSGDERPGMPPEETQAPTPAPSGFDENAALGIAIEFADREGYDPALYSDVVVENAGDHWIVQMRRPRVNRFLEVTVNKDDGSAEMRIRTAQ